MDGKGMKKFLDEFLSEVEPILFPLILYAAADEWLGYTNASKRFDEIVITYTDDDLMRFCDIVWGICRHAYHCQK